ncbi:DNA cytosine methyltransferase [Streptacidiphilus griseoplanus]|uniref:DNA cytosine methyltransferase n=1 Tax=Peterkaempfera griseoplana TaxID=66896 RepID=UPI0006E1EEDF|nr:DNA cytosine methyltransferase [Peterkaempfera griseoplana]
MSHPHKIVDLFAGPGGFDIAAHNLGLHDVLGVENDENACATREAAGLRTLPTDVRDLHPRALPEGFEWFNDATVLMGGPPCQTFSVAGNGHGRAALDEVRKFAHRYAKATTVQDFGRIQRELTQLGEPRTGLVLEPLRWVLEAALVGKPYKVVLLEQVPTVLPVWEEFAAILEGKGYQVMKPEVLCTEEYGVPQTRKRAIFYARWDGVMSPDSKSKLPPPRKTHEKYQQWQRPEKRGVRPAEIFEVQGRDELKPVVTMAKALDRKDCFRVRSNYGTGGVSTNRGYRDRNQPSAAVTGKASRAKLEWEGRQLGEFTLHELGRLQTFPADYPWRRVRTVDKETKRTVVETPEHKGVRSVISQQIGNAVPPLFGMHLLAAALELGDELKKRGEQPLTWPKSAASTVVKESHGKEFVPTRMAPPLAENS